MTRPSLTPKTAPMDARQLVKVALYTKFTEAGYWSSGCAPSHCKGPVNLFQQSRQDGAATSRGVLFTVRRAVVRMEGVWQFPGHVATGRLDKPRCAPWLQVEYELLCCRVHTPFNIF
jgi:hypothetical protein